MAGALPAAADIPPVKRVSCPSVAEINRARPPSEVEKRTLVSLEATPTQCAYRVQGVTEGENLSFGFVDGVSTPKQAEDQLRQEYADTSILFSTTPLPALGAGAFAFSDTGPGALYWQLSPGAVAAMGSNLLWQLDEYVAVAKLFRPMMEVYTIPGAHTVNGRQWRTACEGYSATARCRTDIFATVIRKTPSGYVKVNGWAFNSLTYRWSDRALWTANPLGRTGSWTSAEGRRWRTDCDTATTGRGACRSYLLTTVIDFKGGKYTRADVWVFNNQVLFTT
ncbi:hypothetical protein EAX62_02665 [Tessaracoccus antarcticus]|uniref:Uncharacterized protein n=2 Tax=Tessaracoccus antarcticus TaxID=2479848 RepID=A0A3M0GK87_9ACTN|nr:hypothetical protein EAX62_02665 [Tessaracoccus antarcticus]